MSPSLARLLPLGGSASTTHSVPDSIGEARELVRSELVIRVLSMAVEAQANLLTAASHQKDLYLWAKAFPSRHEEQPLWAWGQPEACRRAAARLLREGNLVLSRGTRHQAEETHDWQGGEVRNKRLVEIRGESSWVVGSILEACRSVTWWLDEGFPELQAAWPRDLNLGSLWLTGASDLAGDQLLLLQGSREQVMAASQGLYPARTVAGRESLIVANSMAQQLKPLEASILVPWALEQDALFYLFG